MSSRRKLYTAAIEILRRELHLRPHPRLLLELHPLPLPSRVSSQRFHNRFTLSRSAVWLWSLYSTWAGGHGAAFACWSCSEPSPEARPFLSCGACGAVQPVDLSVDYFQIFGLEQRYDLKGENLEGKYKEWQKKLHPDLVHSKSEEEKSYAAEQSARVIDAYRTLSRPLSRALYLLQLAGILVDEEKTIMDPELLAEMMDVREAVEEATDPKALMEIQYQIQRKHEDWSNSFREAFNKRDFDSAISATQKMRYYERAIEEIVKKL